MDIQSLPKSRSIKLRSNTQSSPFSRSNTAEYGSLIWKFDLNNHYLHPKLMQWLYSKWVLRLVMISIIPSFFLSSSTSLVGVIYYFVADFIVWIPFLFLIVLSFNRDARGFIIQSSEFWIKFIYAMVRAILFIIRYHYVIREDAEYPYCNYILEAAGLIVIPLILIVVGGADAIPKMEYKWKAALTGILALFFTKSMIEYQFLKSRDLDLVLHVESTGSEISFHALLCNTSGIIALFLWKQTVDVIRNRDRCVSITYRPYLEWINGAGTSMQNDFNEILPESYDDGRVTIGTDVSTAKELVSDSKSDLQKIVCCS